MPLEPNPFWHFLSSCGGGGYLLVALTIPECEWQIRKDVKKVVVVYFKTPGRTQKNHEMRQVGYSASGLRIEPCKGVPVL